MSTFKIFALVDRWKFVVPKLEAVQKMLDFYHKNRNDMLTLESTLPDLANCCSNKPTNAKSYASTGSDTEFLEKENLLDVLSFF